MRHLGQAIAGLAASVALALAAPEQAVADSVSAADCSIAAGGNVRNNSLTCNFGVTTETLRLVVSAAVQGATESYKDQIGQISSQLHVTEDAAKALLRVVGEQPNIPDERLADELTKVAADYKLLKAQVDALNPDNPTARALVAQARAKVSSGDFAGARQLLAEAQQVQIAAAQEAQKLLAQAQAAFNAEMLGAASDAAAEGDVSMTQLDYAGAADLFAKAAANVPPGYPQVTLGYLQRRADALYRQGDERGDNAALVQAIALDESIAQRQPRDQLPLDWAHTQNNLGNALDDLGERESGTADLQAAVAAYQLALQERTRDRVPLDWAATQNNLGAALDDLGERESGTADLQAAVAAYRSALQERTRDRVPLDWAATQNNLGNALRGLGDRESGTADLQAAVAAYKLALQEQARDRVPLDWAETENNLGAALADLGERESGTADLQAAVAAYQLALQERTRDRVPLDWAATQYNLGKALRVLGERESGTADLKAAVAAWNNCLVITATIWPPPWVDAVRSDQQAAQREIAQRTAE